MSVQPGDLLGLANTLAASGTEAQWRCAISRGYYAAYHACSSWHDALPMPGANSGIGGGVHQVLINRLRHPDVTVPHEQKQLSKVLAAKLEVLRGQRTQADYHLADAIDAVQAANACARCSEMLSKV